MHEEHTSPQAPRHQRKRLNEVVHQFTKRARVRQVHAHARLAHAYRYFVRDICTIYTHFYFTEPSNVHAQQRNACK